MHWAAVFGHLEALKLLHQYKGDINILSGVSRYQTTEQYVHLHYFKCIIPMKFRISISFTAIVANRISLLLALSKFFCNILYLKMSNKLHIVKISYIKYLHILVLFEL